MKCDRVRDALDQAEIPYMNRRETGLLYAAIHEYYTNIYKVNAGYTNSY